MLLVGAAVLGLGASNLWTVTLSYVAAASDRTKRSEVVSAYLFQVSLAPAVYRTHPQPRVVYAVVIFLLVYPATHPVPCPSR
jgi:hypothetical protein